MRLLRQGLRPSSQCPEIATGVLSNALAMTIRVALAMSLFCHCERTSLFVITSEHPLFGHCEPRSGEAIP